MRKIWNVIKPTLLLIGLFVLLIAACIKFLGTLCYEIGMENSVYELVKGYVSLIQLRKERLS